MTHSHNADALQLIQYIASFSVFQNVSLEVVFPEIRREDIRLASCAPLNSHELAGHFFFVFRSGDLPGRTF